jgi:hypothetical protein
MSNSKEALLFSEATWITPENLYSCWNARGLYSPMQFVMRLRPDVHRALTQAPSGLVKGGELSDEQILAFSTYLHETVHWWQHVGTTSGILLSLLFPAQAHATRDHLTNVAYRVGPFKPLVQATDSIEIREVAKEVDLKEINIALNNWHDIEFCKWLILDPTAVMGKLNSNYFLSVGNSFYISLGSVLSIIISTIDQSRQYLPDPSIWNSKQRKLRESKVTNFHSESDVVIPSLEAKEIFEGQARFSQLQYLFHASGGKHLFSDFNKMGMLEGIYVKAFDWFIRKSGLELCENLDAPIFGLFLAIFDVALNPAEGLIFDFPNYVEIVTVVDPGSRFQKLCAVVSSSPSLFISLIKTYSSDDYFRVTDRLCAEANFISPKALSEKCYEWSKTKTEVGQLLDEDASFEFTEINLPIRVFMARFFRLQLDKLRAPQFFCWPGVSMSLGKAEGIDARNALALFEEHRALFVDKEDGDVYPRTFATRSESAVAKTFNIFYSWVCTYDLTRQWLTEPGPFNYNFSWLTSKYPESEIRVWASNSFHQVYGLRPDDIRVLQVET